jgi:hypothetical protein
LVVPAAASAQRVAAEARDFPAARQSFGEGQDYKHLSKLSSAELANRRVNSGVQFRNAASQNRSKFRQRLEDQSL